MTTDANIVVIGAGIIGSSVAYHLADMGVEGVVVVDKGDLDHNDGSTSHAPGGLRTLTPSRFFTTLGSESRKVYDKLPLAIEGQEQFFRTGFVQIANTEERLGSHRRLREMGLSHGFDSPMLTPDEVAEKLPLVDPSQIAGGIFHPLSGIVKTSLIATSMRQVSEATGRTTWYGDSEVTDIEVEDGRIVAVVTDGEAGRITCNQAIFCTNIWAPLLAEKTGVSMPLFPGEHQYIFTNPVAALDDRKHTEVTMPVVTFDDIQIYFRQHHDHIGIGSYAHEARLVDPKNLPKSAMLPFTPEDFTDGWELMQRHMPPLRDAGIRDGFNGMFSFTVDDHPIMGESNIKGLWSAVGAWLSFASEVGAVMARWMTTGDPGMDVAVADINRFHPHQSNREFLSRQSKYFYEIGFEDLHPSAVASSVRGLRHAPYHHRLEALGAELVPFASQETPLYYASNEPLVAKHRESIPDRVGYDATGWTPIMGAEHLEMRENVGMVDWSAAIGPIEVRGPGALEHLQYLCTADIDLPIGGVAYSLVLAPSGGITRDVTVTRIDEDIWWILTGIANMPAEIAAFSALAPDDGSVTYRDCAEEHVAIGLWGPNARAVLEATSTSDVSNDGFPWYTAKTIDVGMAKVKAVRISYVGELGWELYVPPSFALHVWDTLWEAGRAFDMPAVGVSAVMSGRIEKGYRLFGSDMSSKFTPAESGVAWAMDKTKDFFGKEAALAAPVNHKLVTLQFENPTSVIYGHEPVFIGDEVVGRVTGGEYGYNVGAFLAHAFVDPKHGEPGTAVVVQASGIQHAASIVKGPLFDPTSARIKG